MSPGTQGAPAGQVRGSRAEQGGGGGTQWLREPSTRGGPHGHAERAAAEGRVQEGEGRGSRRIWGGVHLDRGVTRQHFQACSQMTLKVEQNQVWC